MSNVHVQTSIPDSLHETLARLARKRKQSIKALVHEALEEYCRRETPLEDDPLFQVVGTVEGVGEDWSERKGWRFPE